LTNIAGLLLISGLGGVGMAAMSAAFTGGGRARLAMMWRAALMLQIVLAVPMLAFCLVRADQIVLVLYGPRFAAVVPWFRLFLGFAIVGRLVGGGAHQSALYVVGRQRSVLFTRWAGLVVNVVLDIALIPIYGPVGALFGTGFSQVWVGIIEYLLVRGQVPHGYPTDFMARMISATIIPMVLLTWWQPAGVGGLAASSVAFAVLIIFGLMLTRPKEAGDLQLMMMANPRLRKIADLLSRGSGAKNRNATADAALPAGGSR
ncbi:MAG: polysaccharide biosynthesis C-terminal domain-containing protein, partial [Ktedonobacterales bacterium]